MATGAGGARRRRLTRSGEFDRVYREGRSHANRYLILYAFPRREKSNDDEVRLGVSVGRKVGGAVERNRVKRTLREAFWERAAGLPPGHDFVVVGRPDLADLAEREGAPGVARCLDEVLAEANLGDRST